MTLPNIPQTKYWMACAAFLVSTVAMFTTLCNFTEWASFVGVLFTLYGVADVTNTHLQQAKGITKEMQTS